MSIALHYNFRNISNESSSIHEEQIDENSVEQIYLKFCNLIEFPKWLIKLHNLTHINISNNSIECFPPSINLLQNLDYLDISENRLMKLPTNFFQLTQLRYLDVSGNFIENIPSEIKNLQNLEILSFDRNFIMRIPIELTECPKIFQLSFDDCSRLFSFPGDILMMRNLSNVSFRGCNLIQIPSIISSKIMNFSFIGNQLLNCIPQEAVKFIDPLMTTAEFFTINEEDLSDLLTSQSDFIKNSPEIKHFILPNGLLVNLPFLLDKIHTITSSELISLKERSLRAVKTSLRNSRHFLPRELKTILSFPAAICTCRTKIFTEAFKAKAKLSTPYIEILLFKEMSFDIHRK
ncbi:CLUMA_CG005018, isoform A [Clunio marinus]|uniref:CLUMA_CG005018, isoform A n=1 Tax=Clunio marinus TaxID=568069 RepID=A0A1J1HYZ8_9DIPT|nr:CLUMA_CG005018, isoform A [Clunio marinus]